MTQINCTNLLRLYNFRDLLAKEKGNKFNCSYIFFVKKKLQIIIIPLCKKKHKTKITPPKYEHKRSIEMPIPTNNEGQKEIINDASNPTKQCQHTHHH